MNYQQELMFDYLFTDLGSDGTDKKDYLLDTLESSNYILKP